MITLRPGLLKETSLCVVDQAGRRRILPTDPAEERRAIGASGRW
jgi:hypothetical protein